MGPIGEEIIKIGYETYLKMALGSESKLYEKGWVTLTGRSVAPPHPHRHYTYEEFMNKMMADQEFCDEFFESGKDNLNKKQAPDVSMNGVRDYGTVTVGTESLTPKELKIVDFVQSQYKDNRLISVSMLEDDSYVLAVENPVSTGRAIQSTMRLSKESLMGLISGIFLYFECKKEDMGTALKEATGKNLIDYTFSDNLGPIEEKK